MGRRRPVLLDLTSRTLERLRNQLPEVDVHPEQAIEEALSTRRGGCVGTGACSREVDCSHILWP